MCLFSQDTAQVWNEAHLSVTEASSTEKVARPRGHPPLGLLAGSLLLCPITHRAGSQGLSQMPGKGVSQTRGFAFLGDVVLEPCTCGQHPPSLALGPGC